MKNTNQKDSTKDIETQTKNTAFIDIQIKALTQILQKASELLHTTGHSSNYKSILLPILLYKRLCDTHEEEAYINQVNKTNQHRFNIPKECLWQDFINSEFNLKDRLKKAFSEIEKNNEDLDGLLELGSSARHLQDNHLRHILYIFDTHKIGSLTIPDEQMGVIFTALLEHLARGEGRNGGNYLTPPSVASLLARISTQGKKNIINAYDPACGSAGLLLAVAEQTFVIKELAGQDINADTLRLARMNVVMHGVKFSRVNLKLGNTLNEPHHLNKKYDVVLCVPPFGVRWDPSTYRDRSELHAYGPQAPRSRADFAFVQHMLSLLDIDGTMVITLPMGALFRGNTEQKIRKHLIQNLNCLDAVIGLPPNLFYGTAIPTCALVFKKQRQDEKTIFFIDASNEYGKERWHNYLQNQDLEKILASLTQRTNVELYSENVSIDQIKKNNFNLSLPLYIDEYRKETIHNFVEFHNLVEKYNGKGVVFRGVKDSKFELIPSIGRLPVDSTKIEDTEDAIFKQFREQALPHLSFTPRNDWEWLALAQHHGLPTRLLDWTVNPLIALYFAVEEECKTDSAVYIYTDCESPVETGLPEYQNPLRFPSERPVLRYIPAHLTPRIIAQSGLFTTHQNVTQGFTSEQIFKVVIPNSLRTKLKQQLYRYGIHRGTVYPGLDGTSAHIKWINCQSGD
ncbi:N-6 DNA methylase [Pseudomonas sp. HS6]|uniref:N-6 DNA methylase n=1 Tax=Pseudomonas sp. HS6 TaxID=2850559 RepID=UPI0020187C47|nr:N-6 DNA methylase [Pseudomonas sp. HS6]UQS17444.1 N-6 DNA methylase [Pseudomonas sp. HS6]